MCIAAATGSVNDTLAAEGVQGIVDFDFIPWGNAYYSKVTGNSSYDREGGVTSWLTTCGEGTESPPAACFEGPILCQHGTNECKGNLIEGCVKVLLEEVAAKYWPFMACFEKQDIDRVSPDSPIKAMNACTKQLGWPASKVSALKRCVESDDVAHNVSVTNARKTAALVPAHQGTPWILLDGELFQGDNLLKAVCEAYKGEKPAGCSDAAIQAAFRTNSSALE